MVFRSGLALQTENQDWRFEDIDPYITETVAIFGNKRCMFGSDWPVCTLVTTYQRWIKTVERSLSALNLADQSAVFTRNALTIYNIKTLQC